MNTESKLFSGLSSLVIFSALVLSPGASAQVSAVTASGACTRDEAWSFGDGLEGWVEDAYDKFLDGDLPADQAYAQALSSMASAKTASQRRFLSFWMARALQKAGLHHKAFDGFAMSAAETPTRETLSIQLASIACMNRLLEANPGLKAPRMLLGRIPAYLALIQSRKERAEAEQLSLKLALDEIASDPDRALEAISSGLKGSPALESLARGFLAAERGMDRETITRLREFFASSDSAGQSDWMRKQADLARLLLARAYYGAGQYGAAAIEYRKLSRSSNDLSVMLSELTWANYRAIQYREAIGNGLGLKSASLREAFMPEIPMIAAMSFHELCQYPEALQAVGIFARDYRASYDWLLSWSKNPSDLYPLAVSYLLKEEGSVRVPRRVASEWLRSPVFLAGQSEIERYFEEERVARSTLSGPRAWMTVISNVAREAEAGKARWVSLIEADLKARTSKMLKQLQEVAANNRLIEIEVFSRAGQDLVWRNAHPDYKQILKKLEAEKEQSPGPKAWVWSAPRTDSDGNAEIWEDELGNFTAKVENQCAVRKEYSVLKMPKTGRND